MIDWVTGKLMSWVLDKCGFGEFWDNYIFYRSFKLIINRWTWELVPKWLAGGLMQFRHSREITMATLRAGTTPKSGLQLAPAYWKEFSGNTYLTHRPIGREGRELESAKIHLNNLLIRKDQLIDMQSTTLYIDLQGSAQNVTRTWCQFQDIL